MSKIKQPIFERKKKTLIVCIASSNSAKREEPRSVGFDIDPLEWLPMRAMSLSFVKTTLKIIPIFNYQLCIYYEP